MGLDTVAAGARRLADALDDELVAGALDDASFAIKRDALAVVGRVAGADRRLSRFGGGSTRGRTRMGVRYTVTGRRSLIQLKPAAMWALTTGRVRRHVIGVGRRGRTGKVTRGRGARRMVLPTAATSKGRTAPSRVRPAPINHPGHGPRGSLLAVYRRVPDHVQSVFGDALVDAVNRWKG